MTRNEFIKVFCNVIDLYGEKHYPAVRQNLIYDVVKNLSQDIFTKIVNEIIGNERYAPLLDDFKKYAKPFLAEYNAKFISEIRKNNMCSKCDSFGVICIEKPYLKSTADYAYGCDCLIGKKLYPNFPRLSR